MNVYIALYGGVGAAGRFSSQGGCYLNIHIAMNLRKFQRDQKKIEKWQGTTRD